jgi:iron complex transport system permease protein
VRARFDLGTTPCGLTRDQFDILFQIRLPRILLAAAVGGSLATAGAGYQALLRNPLAEPYLLGISNGAAVGTMIALVFFGANEWTRPLLAFTGALAATLAVYRLARGRAGATPERLILAGVIVTTFLSSVIVFVTTLMDATRIRSFTFWLLGDLSGNKQGAASGCITIALVGALALTLYARSLNLLMLGERDAFDLGVEVGRVRSWFFSWRVCWWEARWRRVDRWAMWDWLCRISRGFRSAATTGSVFRRLRLAVRCL